MSRYKIENGMRVDTLTGEREELNPDKKALLELGRRKYEIMRKGVQGDDLELKHLFVENPDDETLLRFGRAYNESNQKKEPIQEVIKNAMDQEFFSSLKEPVQSSSFSFKSSDQSRERGVADFKQPKQRPVLKKEPFQPSPAQSTFQQLEQPSSEQQVQSSINPKVKDYLLNKYQILDDKVYQDKKDKAYQDYNSNNLGLNIATAFASLGDSLQGKVGASDSYFDNVRNRKFQNTVGRVEGERKDAMTALDNQQKLEEFNVERSQSDPNSQASLSFRKTLETIYPDTAALLKKNLGDDNFNNISAKDAPNIFNIVKLKEDTEARKAERAAQLSFQQSEARERSLDRRLNRELKEQELANKNTLEGKLAKLNTGDRARFDNVLMVLKGIDDMGTALDNDTNTFSVVGDNEYTMARERAAEAFGRMQSGGAINNEEGKKFKGYLPSSTDSKEIQRKKLIDQRNEMLSRLKTLGFTPDEVGYKPVEFKYGKNESTKSTTPSSSTQSKPIQGKPKVLEQDGHYFYLNEATGEYESK